MSQYLNFQLVNKNDSSIKIDLGYWCTSMARTIDSCLGYFRYTEDFKPIDSEYMNSFTEKLQEEIDGWEKSKLDRQNELKKYQDMLPKCENKEIFEEIQEYIHDIEESIESYNEEIEMWIYTRNKMIFISDVLDENKDNYELQYNNC